MTNYEQAYRDLRAGVEALVENTEWDGWGGERRFKARVRALLASSAPATASEHRQRADHYQYLYEQASEGKCGPSGLTIGACKASICDCFEFPWVKAAPEEHPDPATVSEDATLSDSVTDSVTSSDGDGGLSEIVAADGWEGVEVDGLIERAVEAIAWGLLDATSDTADRCPSKESHDAARATAKRILAACTAQPEGVERVEWGISCRGDINRRAEYGMPDEGAARQEVADTRIHGHCDPRLVRRTVTEYAPVVGPWEVVGDE